MLGILAVGSTDTDTDTQKVKAQSARYTVTADQLASEYKSNEVAADAKYKGKVVIVSGTVQDIGKDVMDDAYIIIGGEKLLDSVQCFFTEGQQSSVARLSKGQHVRVKGEVGGKMIVNILVSKCTLQ
jgi:hypothetical protein